jgi:ribonuclease T
MTNNRKKKVLSNRFRGLLPVVVDVETTGLNPEANGLLEIAVVVIGMDEAGQLFKSKSFSYHIEPFKDAHLDPEALEITKIDPGYPLRYAVPERHALHSLFRKIQESLQLTDCRRAVLVGHNAWFDLAFIQAAIKRNGFKTNPFHSFTTFDTASLSALILGETVLAKAVRKAGLPFDINKAHSAIYDADRTAELFCYIVNKTQF